MTNARTDRINAIADEITSHLQGAIHLATEIMDLEVPPDELAELFRARKMDLTSERHAQLFRFAYALMGQVPPAPSGEELVRQQIDALFQSDGVKVGDSDEPAIPDVGIVLRGAGAPISGVLSRTKAGMLKLGLVQPPAQRGDAPQMIDTFFTYDDVIAVAVARPVKSSGPTILTAH